ncbi:MAG TPA: FHA domain-containing protein [Kofleriaceae bacterium]|nr:FHA domain-containing protein [Kofleriaceae bacterium]
MLRSAFVALVVLASTARADDATKQAYHATIDRIDYERASIGGMRLRVYLSAWSTDGQRLDLTDPKSIRLLFGGAEKQFPYALGTYDASGGDTAIVILVQATQDFADALPTISDALDHELLSSLGEHTQLAVASYGQSLSDIKLAPVKKARGALSGLSSDGSVGDPVLLDSLDRAEMVLKRAGAKDVHPLRKIIIVIGDGRDAAGDKDRVTAAAKRAAKDGVRIHTFAYSPGDVRRPLLVLGELSKWSLGTFRWPGRGHKPTAETWSDAFRQLGDEIAKQYVVTYFVTADDSAGGQRLSIKTAGRTEATSNELRVPEAPSCAGATCDRGYCAETGCVAPPAPHGRGVLFWLLVIGGGLIGAVVVLGVIGYGMTKRAERAQRLAMMPPAVPGSIPPMQAMPHAVQPQPFVPPSQPPGILPNGRPIPALLVMNGPRTGQRVTLRNGFLIGKQPGCDLQIEDGYTSSQHAQIGMDPAGNCHVYDCNSTNGTFLNGVRVNMAALEHGATLKVGSIELRFLAQ